MLTRVALFEGVIQSGGADAFFAAVRERLEPIWRSFPHVVQVRVLRTSQADRGAIPIVMVLEKDFPTSMRFKPRSIRISRIARMRRRLRCSSPSVVASFTSLPRVARSDRTNVV